MSSTIKVNNLQPFEGDDVNLKGNLKITTVAGKEIDFSGDGGICADQVNITHTQSTDATAYIPIVQNLRDGCQFLRINSPLSYNGVTNTLQTTASHASIASQIDTVVNDGLILEGTTSASTSQAVYGVNVVSSSTTSNFSTRLPDPITGRQTVIVNNSTMPISVFPSVAGGEINGGTGSALIPNDGRAYLFYCIDNPLPGAWSWNPPALGQIQLPTIEVAHTQSTETNAYGIGNPGAQIITGSTLFYDVINGSYGGSGIINLQPSQDYWGTTNFHPKRTMVRTKVYSNFKASDSPDLFLTGGPTVKRVATYFINSTTVANYSAASTPILSQTVNAGPSNSPAEIGDTGTYYAIQDSNTAQVAPADTDSLGIGDFSPFYYSFKITIPSGLDTKLYKFDIFLEHS
jgi:hypothetical protein